MYVRLPVKPKAKSRRRLLRFGRRLSASTKNALELLRLGQLAPDYGAPYEVVDQSAVFKLRRYVMPPGLENAPPVLLVPPLMVTSEVYDVAPDVSAVTALASLGVAPWVVDFGAPEHAEGGMKRTLDDHVRAVDRAIDRVLALTSRDGLHLAGYSQGGMFAYQACAYRRSRGIKSLVTFGSPVDIHRNVPAVRASAVGALVRAIEPALMGVLNRIEGLPGELTSTGFKVISTRKEIEQRVDFVKKLHDRNALVRREARRRFLGGEGFVAWPGPALRDFVDQFIVHNRMLSGGFVIDGRTATLADITCPVLAFIGLTDDMARPASVRAISRAAPDAKIDTLEVAAGHFGLVVGSRAMQITWPTVASWVAHQEGLAPRPAILDAARSERDDLSDLDDEPEGAAFDVDVDFSLFVDSIAESAKAAWDRLGDVTASATDALDTVRYREPRLRKLVTLDASSRISAAQMLTEQARRSPDATFFLWQGRAFTYRDADQRVTNVVKGLHTRGVRPGDRVAVVMGSRPSFLSMVTALSRLGAISVLVPPETMGPKLAEAILGAEAKFVTCDPELAARCREAIDARGSKIEVLVLGGGGTTRTLGEGLVDMEAIDVSLVELPTSLPLDAGTGGDVAMILLRPDDAGGFRAAEVTNHRWALSAFGGAAACTLKPEDTVYCAIPLHHPAGVLVSVGSALVGGTRLALGRPFSPDTFFSEVRRYGATVVFYAGEMTRALVNQPPHRQDKSLPVRLFAGSGMRVDLWRRMVERFGAGVMEFYASTTEPLIIANASGEKVGALGRPLPGSAELEVVRVDRESGGIARDDRGRAIRCLPGEPGLLVARLDGEREAAEVHRRVDRGLFLDSDRWFVSSDVVRRDAEGDYWFIDSIGGFVKREGGLVSTRRVEDALYELPEIDLAAVFAADAEAGAPRLAACVTSRGPVDPARLQLALATLEPFERPDLVLQVEAIPLTEGFRPQKRLLRAVGVDRERGLARFVLRGDRYEPG